MFGCLVDYEKCFPQELKQTNPQSIAQLPRWVPHREAASMFLSTTTGKRREFADCDVLLCHAFPSIRIGWKVHEAFGTPYIAYVHGIYPIVQPKPHVTGEWNGSLRLLDWLASHFAGHAKDVDTRSLMGAAACLFNSKWTKELIREEYGINGEVCYPGCDHVPVMPYRELSLRDDMIVTASRHSPWKRIDLTLEALQTMHHKPRLLIIGQETKYTKHLRRLVKINPLLREKVTFLGFVNNEERNYIFSKAKAYVLSSIHEPFGITPLEAASCGTPSVMWGDAGAKETVVDGETGYVVEPYNVGQFASALDYLLDNNDRWSGLSTHAKHWAQSFSWNSHMNILENTLGKAVRG